MDESILVNYLRGGSNDEECRQVELWCEEAPENRQILEQLYYTLFVGDRMAVMDAVDTEASLTKFKSLVREKEKKAKRRSISVRWGRYASAAAAFLAGLVFAGGIAWGLLSNKLSDYTVMTTGGQRAQTVLPDGSKVWLNASTKLIYRNSFWSTDRQIDLSGEAYFEVARDKHAPFIVNTKHIKTCVLGTKFNVRAREEEDRVVTTLLQGSVRMESPRTVNNGYLLKPGQTLNINTTTYQAELIEYAEPTEVLLWINGKLKFKQHSLLEITNIMEKLYDLKFVYDDESLKVERFTGEFSTDNLPDEILNVLMHTNHFSYKKEGRIIRLSKKYRDIERMFKKGMSLNGIPFLFELIGDPLTATLFLGFIPTLFHLRI